MYIRLDAMVAGLAIGVTLGYLILHADSVIAWLSRAAAAVA
jgi:hypothetical protein